MGVSNPAGNRRVRDADPGGQARVTRGMPAEWRDFGHFGRGFHCGQVGLACATARTDAMGRIAAGRRGKPGRGRPGHDPQRSRWRSGPLGSRRGRGRRHGASWPERGRLHPLCCHAASPATRCIEPGRSSTNYAALARAGECLQCRAKKVWSHDLAEDSTIKEVRNRWQLTSKVSKRRCWILSG